MEILDYPRGKPSFYSREKAEAAIMSLTGEDARRFYTELDASEFYAGMKGRNDYLRTRFVHQKPLPTPSNT